MPEIARGCGAARPSRWCVCGSAHDSQRRVSDACRLAHITPCGYESLEIAPKSCSRRSCTATPVDRTMAAALGSRSLRSQSLMAALRARELSRIPRASRCSGTVGAGLRVPTGVLALMKSPTKQPYKVALLSSASSAPIIPLPFPGYGVVPFISNMIHLGNGTVFTASEFSAVKLEQRNSMNLYSTSFFFPEAPLGKSGEN